MALSTCSVQDAEPTPNTSVSLPNGTPTPETSASAPVATPTLTPLDEIKQVETTPLANTEPTPTSDMTIEEFDSELQTKVISVTSRGEPGSYSFSVTIESPDTGCGQYADWWEVISSDGKLLYRRILLHSHVGEQPFTRSGGSVDIQADDIVSVRAHMNTSGYSGIALRGSVAGGFETEVAASEFAPELEGARPQPDDCDF